jgi:hypothetical protein
MTRVQRRVRWMAIAAISATAVGTLAAGAQAYADRDTSRCAQQAFSVTGTQAQSWRSGALRAMGCRAWRHLHRQRTLVRSSGP